MGLCSAGSLFHTEGEMSSYSENVVLIIDILLLTTLYIQGVLRIQGITARGDFPEIKKSSYKHVSDFGRLRSYDRFFIPVHVLV
jgi:hypothetical protein